MPICGAIRRLCASARRGRRAGCSGHNNMCGAGRWQMAAQADPGCRESRKRTEAAAARLRAAITQASAPLVSHWCCHGGSSVVPPRVCVHPGGREARALTDWSCPQT